MLSWNKASEIFVVLELSWTWPCLGQCTCRNTSGCGGASLKMLSSLLIPKQKQKANTLLFPHPQSFPPLKSPMNTVHPCFHPANGLYSSSGEEIPQTPDQGSSTATPRVSALHRRFLHCHCLPLESRFLLPCWPETVADQTKDKWVFWVIIFHNYRLVSAFCLKHALCSQ